MTNSMGAVTTDADGVAFFDLTSQEFTGTISVTAASPWTGGQSIFYFSNYEQYVTIPVFPEITVSFKTVTLKHSRPKM